MTSCAELIIRARAGDCRSLAPLVRELASLVYPLAVRAGGDPLAVTRELVIVVLTSLASCDDEVDRERARIADVVARELYGLIIGSEDS